jgi:hypothetical protein
MRLSSTFSANCFLTSRTDGMINFSLFPLMVVLSSDGGGASVEEFLGAGKCVSAGRTDGPSWSESRTVAVRGLARE